jgi:hypothetical protein
MSDVEDPAGDGGGAVDEQAIVDGRITFVALLKDVCGLNRREVDSLTASGITSLSAVRRLKEDRFNNTFAKFGRHGRTRPRHVRTGRLLTRSVKLKNSISKLSGRKSRFAMRLDETLKTFEMSV